jgi:transcription antitermination protein NusB
MQALYSHYTADDGDARKSEDALLFSIEKMREMYLYLLLIIVEMQGQAIDRIESGRNKKLPTKEDLHPNTKFVTNKPLRALVNSKTLKKACDNTGVSWSDNRDLLKRVFKVVTETEDYQEYMASEERGFDHDKEYLLRFFKRHMINVEEIHDYFEEKSIFWNDDLDLISSMVIKSLKLIEEDADDIELLLLWKEGDDEKDFTQRLFRQTLALGKESEDMIQESAKNWELDRIAVIDMILMKMALAEARTFESIPLKVTLNEYIELSKYYSTPKSNGFINGVLDQLFTKLKDDGTIKKVGRGLLQ